MIAGTDVPEMRTRAKMQMTAWDIGISQSTFFLFSVIDIQVYDRSYGWVRVENYDIFRIIWLMTRKNVSRSSSDTPAVSVRSVSSRLSRMRS